MPKSLQPQLRPWQAMVPRWVYAYELETNVAGVTHANSDGTSRQEIVERLHRHSHADLRRERGNPVDFNAIAVYSRLGQVGYLPADLSARLAPTLDSRQIRVRGAFQDIGTFEGDSGEELWFAKIDVQVYERIEVPGFSGWRFLISTGSSAARAVWHGFLIIQRVIRIAMAAIDGTLRRMAGEDRFFLWTLRGAAILGTVIGTAVLVATVL